MSVRNLDYLLKPRSIALIGASKDRGSVGAVVARNLFNAGFDGPVMPVNPKHRAVEGVLAYPDIESLPVTPDLAVIATPPPTVPGIVAELGARGTKAAVVITAGFGEGAGAEGAKLRQAMLDAAKPHTLRVLGPNCIGLIVPGLGVNASFAHMTPRPGDIAFVTQSGASLPAVMDWAASHGVGFSHLVSVGDMSDVDFGDLLDYLAVEQGTRAVLIYMEAISEARKFMSAARAAARAKPVIAVKTGRSEAAAKAVLSHTGALAGSDAVYEAAFNRAGMLRVRDVDELFDAVQTLALARRPSGDRLAILTNGGGFGVLAADALMEEGGRLAELSDETMARLDGALPPIWSRTNPVDIVGDADGPRYAAALEALLDDEGIDAVLVLNAPTAVASSTEAAEAVIETVDGRRRCVLASWQGPSAAAAARELFGRHGIPSYYTPEQAVRAFMHMVNYRRNQELLMETPPSVPKAFTVDGETARGLVETARAEGREWLTEPESKELLAAAGVPTVPTHVVDSGRAAAARAAELGVPVALKVVSPEITHKSDVGGVALDLASPQAVQAAAEAMAERIAEERPDARLEGFTVQPMVHRPGAYELIVGVVADPLFGPVILFGQGGTAVEIVGDTALGLPPLNMKLARDLMARTRIYRQLVGFRGRPAADLDALALTLVKVSQLVVEVADVAELDINPLLADEYGVVALDARVRIAEKSAEGAARFAIRPYPSALEREAELADGTRVRVRPIRPEDEPAIREGFRRLTPRDVRMRFFGYMKELPHALAARLTQIDYDREMAFVAEGLGAGEGAREGTREALGVVRINADPDNERAEYAVTVRSDLQRRGLGRLLMNRMIEYARGRGIGELFGHVLEENTAMLELCRRLGFSVTRVSGEPGVVRVSLPLREAAGGREASA